MAVTEDAATVLEQFIHDGKSPLSTSTKLTPAVANLPAEIAHLYEEANAKQLLINECNATIATHDGNLQRQVKQQGTQNVHPKEPLLVKAVRDAYARAAQLQDEKIALVAKASGQLDRYVRRLDVKIRDLQAEGAMPLDGAMPTLLRATAAGNLVPADLAMAASQAGSGASTPLQPLSGNAAHGGGAAASFPAAALSRLAQHAAAAARPGGRAAGVGANKASDSSGTASTPHPDALKRRRAHAPSSLGATAAPRRGPRGTPASARDVAAEHAGRRGGGRAGPVPRTTGAGGALKKAASGTGRGWDQEGRRREHAAGRRGRRVRRAQEGRRRRRAAAAVAERRGGGSGHQRRARRARRRAQVGHGGGAQGQPGRRRGGRRRGRRRRRGGGGAERARRPARRRTKEARTRTTRTETTRSDDDESALSSGPDASGSEVGSRVGARRAASNASGATAARRAAPPGVAGGAAASGRAGTPAAVGSAAAAASAAGAGDRPRATGPDAKKKLAGATNVDHVGGGGVDARRGRRRRRRRGLELDEAADDTKYCYCHDVSHGDMIACDNADCRTQWFHWTCAGIESEPQGEWLCRDCRRLPRERIRKQLQ